jgi:hypothetical protein
MRFEKKFFSNEEVLLDGNEFIDCHFDHCTMIYGGGTLPDIVNCSFKNPNWSLVKAASNTLELLTLFYHNLEGGKQLIENTFNYIRHSENQNLKKSTSSH